MARFGVSQAVTRREDERLLTGAGRFTDDHHLPGLAHAYLLRAPYAHARITQLDVSSARRAPGVLAVYTAADLAAAGLGAIPCLSKPKPKAGTEFHERRQPLLVADTVRFIGDGVAFIVADTAEQARDAAELVEVDYDALAAVVAADLAARPDAVPVWDDVPDNVSFHWELGDAEAVNQAFTQAARVITLEVVNNRVIINPLENRAALGQYDPATDKLTLVTNTQMPNTLRDQLAGGVLHLDPARLRVRVQDVGGGFGGRNSLYPEQALVLHAARELQRPVKWSGSRSEGFVSDFQGRDNVTRGELAVDATGRFLGLRVTTYANLGAYTASRGPLSPVNIAMASNTYRIPAISLNVKGVYTHTVPTDPYRGAGRPEIIYLVERLVDVAAFDLGIDRIALRRLNFIPTDAFPYATPTGLIYEYCDFAALLDDALTRARWADFPARRAEAAQRGKLRGIGLNSYIERCGGGGGLSEEATLRVETDGTVALYIGTQSNGQGHETAYSQILSERLGLEFERIRIVQGDTDQVAHGHGTGGSWSLPMGGGAVVQAADALIANARRLAAEQLEAADADLEFADGQFTVAGTDVRLSLAELARQSPGLSGAARYQPENYTFPFGCHVAEVEIDPETGAVTLVSYTAVHDFGVTLNPLLLAGQVHGGLAQGIGQALCEQTSYDEDGQLLSGSFIDYRLPRADDLPAFDFVARVTPNPHNPLGIKGCGEAGAAGSPPAVINAVAAALGIRHIDMPATPLKVWTALQEQQP